MLFLVIAEAYESIVGDNVTRLRNDVATAVKRIEASGKLEAGGVLIGRRKLYLVLKVDRPEEVLELLGGELMDNMRCEVYPTASLGALGQFFEEHPWK
jgi:hypothetical protein